MPYRLQTDTADTGSPTAAEAKSILIVDDYPSLCELISASLRPRGYQVFTATSGEEAKAVARKNPKIDLLITDIEMPNMRGDELAAWFRTARTETRILFMSNQRAALADVEALPFLQKPFRPEALLRKVQEVLNHHSAPSAETTPINYGN